MKRITTAMDCPICFSPLSEYPSITLRCHPTHAFHRTCIHECLKRGIEVCPICRANIFHLSSILIITKDISYGLAYGAILSAIIYVFHAIGPFGLLALLVLRTPIWLSRVWAMGMFMSLFGYSLEPYFRASVIEYITASVWFCHVLVIITIAKSTGVRGNILRETHKLFIAFVGVVTAGLLIELADRI